MTEITASVARQTLPHQLDLVESGAEISITRYGRVVAVLVNPAALVERRAPEAWQQAEGVAARLAEAREAPLRRTRLGEGRAEELVSTIHADRAGR